VKLPVYLDNHSTTPVDPRVVEAMLPYFTETFGNAASRTHAFGWAAEGAVEAARQVLADAIGAKQAREIVFTSGATESDNLAIKGAAEHYGERGRHIVTTAIEHKAVIDSCRHLERQGFSVTYVAPGANGIVSADAVEAAITPQTILASVMLANNEVGTIQPIEAIGRVARERGVLFHCDAAQGLGKTPFDVERMNVDLASLSAHKIYGPKGIGALYVRGSGPRVRLVAQMDGGGHERGMRSGTLNVPAAVGFAKACEILLAEADGENTRLRALRDRLLSTLANALEGVKLNGDRDARLPGNLNLSFEGVTSDALMGALRDVALSSGSACTSASLEPSYVLRAMGVDAETAAASIRFGIGRFNKEEEIDFAAARVVAEVQRLREAGDV
jgi:cysteine desulfurase